MVNPDRPWPRPETPRAPLDATDNATLELWATQPEFDTRSLEEFAAEGGRPVGPPNRMEGGPPVWAAFFSFVWGLPWLVFRAARWSLELIVPRRSSIDHALENADRWGRTIPPWPMLIPPPPPPSTPMTGHLRSSLTENERRALGGADGEGLVIIVGDRSLGPDQVLGLNSRRSNSTGGGWPT